MKHYAYLLLFALLLPCHRVRADVGDTWLDLFNGKNLDGWEANARPESFRVEDGLLRAHGRNGMSHLFYVGDEGKDVRFKDFELSAIVRSDPNSNSGIFFHTSRELRNGKYLNKGYEVQLNSSEREKRKTGSLYAVVNLDTSPVDETKWFEVRIRVEGKRIQVHIDGARVVDYVEPLNPSRESSRAKRLLDPRGGAIAIQAHDPGSVFYFKRIRLRKLQKQAKFDEFFSPPTEFAGEFGAYRSPLKFYDGRPVKTADDWQARRREILDRWSKIMGRWPPLIEKPKIEHVNTARRENFTQHHVQIEMAPGLMHPAILLVPDGAGPFPAAVVPFYWAETGAGLPRKPDQPRPTGAVFGYDLAKRGFVTLSLGFPSSLYYPSKEQLQLQPLSALAYVAANCHAALASRPEVDPLRIGIVGHSYGGKWAMFASCLHDKFACAAWSDGGVVFDEQRGNVNYWEPWYLGYEAGKKQRRAGIPSLDNPRTGAYKQLVEQGLDLHELHALMAPRPFLVSGGSEDRPERWTALNHAIAVNNLLGRTNRVAMTNRRGHSPTPESNEQIYRFFERFLMPEKESKPKE